MHYDKNECLVLDEIDENWQKVSKSVTSKNVNTRRRTFFDAKNVTYYFHVHMQMISIKYNYCIFAQKQDSFR